MSFKTYLTVNILIIVAIKEGHLIVKWDICPISG